MEPAQLANRRWLDLFHRKWTRPGDSLETLDRHLIEPPLDFMEPLGPVVADPGPPTHQRVLREDQVRPREYADQVAPQRVIPGWPEAGDENTSGLEEIEHGLKN